MYVVAALGNKIMYIKEIAANSNNCYYHWIILIIASRIILNEPQSIMKTTRHSEKQARASLLCMSVVGYCRNNVRSYSIIELYSYIM